MKLNRRLITVWFLFAIAFFICVFAVAVSARNLSAARIGSRESTVQQEGPVPRALFPIIRTPAEKTSGPATGPIFGVNFINSAEDLADAQQFANGLSTGATWNRWPIYWNIVEYEQGKYNWESQDDALNGDVSHGLKTDAILLGTPGFFTTVNAQQVESETQTTPGMLQLNEIQGAAPIGLYDPIFSDGSDVPGPGKEINSNNRWANFVYLAVNRYKPGGTLSKQDGWSAGQGITHWEMWNEPDLNSFWDSSLADYARLLKVGYLAAKHADSNSTVLFAGLANDYRKPNYYEDVLKIYNSDPLGPQFNYYHDIFATHNYYYSWQSWWHVYRASQTMISFKINKPIWLNETGVRAWDDYPGPRHDPNSPFSATMTEQADFAIQSAFYAAFAGAEAIFHFQLYDGCGNQPQGTDFPPVGDICKDPINYPICAGDANGLFRNPPDAACYTQHPDPESPRLNYDAFKVLTKYFKNVDPLWRLRLGDDDGDDKTGPQELIAFYNPSTKERIIGMWARFGEDQMVELPAKSSQAQLIYPDGRVETITPKNGNYNIHLPGATNQNKPDGWDPNLYPIGGRPRILIEIDK